MTTSTMAHIGVSAPASSALPFLTTRTWSRTPTTNVASCPARPTGLAAFLWATATMGELHRGDGRHDDGASGMDPGPESAQPGRLPAPRMSMTPGPGGAYAAKALFSVIATNVVVPPPVRKALRRYGVPEFFPHRSEGR